MLAALKGLWSESKPRDLAALLKQIKTTEGRAQAVEAIVLKQELRNGETIPMPFLEEAVIYLQGRPDYERRHFPETDVWSNTPVGVAPLAEMAGHRNFGIELLIKSLEGKSDNFTTLDVAAKMAQRQGRLRDAAGFYERMSKVVDEWFISECVDKAIILFAKAGDSESVARIYRAEVVPDMEIAGKHRFYHQRTTAFSHMVSDLGFADLVITTFEEKGDYQTAADLALRAGRSSRAIELLNNAHSGEGLHPYDKWGIPRRIAKLYRELGNDEQATKYFNLALELTMNNFNTPPTHNTIPYETTLDIAMEAGFTEKARTLALSKVQELESLGLHYKAAELAEKFDHKPEAARNYERAGFFEAANRIRSSNAFGQLGLASKR